MNVHDSEKLANLLHHAGLDRARDESSAGLLIINTCSIRDKAENQLYSDLGKLRDWRDEQPGRLIGVGGCVAQQVGDRLLARFPHLDFVFGTHNLKLVPAMVSGARSGQRAVEVGESRSVDRFDLPMAPRPVGEAARCKAFVTVMEGCDMFCSFCIVPATRGREISRPASGILEEVRRLADEGVREVTLLGQTVNAYGRHDVKRGQAGRSGTMAFAELLAELDHITGIERIRYTSPHPLFFDRALVQAHASLKSLCPHVHLPVQSGSDRILDAMRRRYRRESYMEIAHSLRSAVPGITLTSDLIVGFPGETEEDFEQTLDLMQTVGFEDSYSFIYSPRPGTGAAEMPGGLDRAEGRRRLDALQGLQRRLTMDYHRRRVGSSTRVLVEGPSRHGAGQVCGRDPHHRVVNLVSGGGAVAGEIKPGDLVEVEIVEATPHSLLGEAVFSGGGPSVSV
ncbi:MAG: tRNA (N6-isopentenyl adenosine(37)-C2)-methylthiotransferase MiaB [bacterium TMED88]|nr:tRNA (N6-isopentenyl adenosine(37)-C2)-methylthiotransferase MiaB [Deltaproteobacteria bacterium]OUV34984.1 MAG: tRNA (N6-isopentenyl adenosine(37)-C2)-methylthiotransferase MiaB [bacterium TMED88]